MMKIMSKQMKKIGRTKVTAIAIAIGLSCLFLLLSLSMPALAQDQPDLTITDISVYHTYYYTEDKNKAWEDLDNTVNVTVENIGSDDASSFEVKLLADGDEIGTETVPSLAKSENIVSSFTWHPLDTGSYSLEAVAYSDGEINESDVGNNELKKDASVVHNGYMGDKTLLTYDHDTITGGIEYTIGDSYYSGTLGDTYIVTHEVTIPSEATVKFARLYSYWTWAKTLPDMKLSFDGNMISPDAEYTDRKGEGWGSKYDYPTGTYAYDVSSYVTGSGGYTTVIENTGSDFFCMDGLGLLVVYTDASGSEIEYWINEGCDMLSTMCTSGGLTPEEATATSDFEGTVDWGSVERASLTTVVQSGCHLGTKLVFNDEDWTEVFDGTPYTDLDIDEERDVTDYLVSTDNTIKIEAPALEDDGGDYLVPSNAFLVLYYEEEEEEEGGEVAPDSPNITAWNPVDAVVNNTEGESRTFNITVNQTVDISWQINGTKVQTNKTVTKAVYTNTSAVVGTWNVSVIATNTATELTDIHTWIWNVTLMPATTPTPAVNITTTSTPTATPIPTSTPTLAITPTSTPTPAEEKKQPGEEETPVPGFELAMSSFILIAVAYLLRKRRKL